MGDAVGVHDDAELAGLNPQQRDQLKQEVLRQLATNQQIRDIINRDPTILTSDSAINEVLKAAVAPTLQRLRGGG